MPISVTVRMCLLFTVTLTSVFDTAQGQTTLRSRPLFHDSAVAVSAERPIRNETIQAFTMPTGERDRQIPSYLFFGDTNSQASNLLNNNSRFQSAANRTRALVDVGDTLSFNTPVPLVNAWQAVDFTLTYQDDSVRVWVQSDLWLNGVTSDHIVTVAEALRVQTPASSVDPSSGILGNNLDMFGPTPNIDGDGTLDILLFDILDDYSPGIRGYIPGVISVEDYIAETPAGRGNHQDILYIDVLPQLISDFGSIDDVVGITAAMHQTLAQFFSDSDEDAFLVTGLREIAKTANGYSPIGYEYLDRPIEHNVELLAWDGFIGDSQRSSLFLHYLAQRIGLTAVAGLSKDTTNGLPSIATVVEAAPLDLKVLTLDFHTANFVNSQIANPAWGYADPNFHGVHASTTSTLDASFGTTLVPTTNTLAPGAVQYLQWQNVRNLNLTVDALDPQQRDRFRARVVLDETDGSRSVVDLMIGDLPNELSGSFDAATIILVDVALEAGPTTFSLSATWSGTAYATTNSIFDSGQLFATGPHFYTIDTDWRQAVRFDRPTGMDLVRVYVDPFFLNELADENGIVQGQPGDPRDFNLDFYYDSNGLPGEIAFSIAMTDPRSYQLQTTNTLQFVETDLTDYPEIQIDADVRYIGLSNVGLDDNDLVLGLSTYPVENTSFLFGNFDTEYSWRSLWSLTSGNTSLANRSIPIRAQFRSTVPTGTDASPEPLHSQITTDLFPNPTSNTITVEFDVQTPEEFSYQVVDILGRIIVKQDLGYLPIGLHRALVDVSALAGGQYFLGLRGTSNRAFDKFAIVR